MKSFILFLLLFSFTFVEAQTPLQVQSQSRFRIGVEYGTHQMSGKIDNRWEFRHPSFRYSRENDTSGSEYARGNGTVHHFGIKTELSAWENRLTFATGLRYIAVSEQITPHSSTSIYLFHPSQQGIELFRIQEMEERLGYIGIPLEIDYLLWGRYSNWQGYVKAGIQGGMKIHGASTLNFMSKEMEKYSDEIFTTAGKAPSRFFLNSYAGLGLRLILQNGMRLSAEIILPPKYLTKGNFTLLTPETNAGGQFSITMPIHSISHK